jgi:pyruvate-formate lyase-activating enzyme
LLLKELRPEYPFYHSSRGGVTFSGGEPTLSAEFAVQLARSLKQDGIHMAIETCGLFHMEKDAKPAYEPKLLPTTSRKATRELFRLVDLVLFDIKLFQEKTHQKFCGTTNRLIKDNLTLMARLFHKGEGPVIWPRMPVIPGITDTTDNLEDWGNLLGELELNQLTLVPYHNLGNAKREWLQLEPGPRLDTLTRESLEKTRRILTKIGITCYEPGEEEWPQTSQSSPSKPN